MMKVLHLVKGCAQTLVTLESAKFVGATKGYKFTYLLNFILGVFMLIPVEWKFRSNNYLTDIRIVRSINLTKV